VIALNAVLDPLDLDAFKRLLVFFNAFIDWVSMKSLRDCAPHGLWKDNCLGMNWGLRIP